jgi:hypothetical protein
MVDFFLFNLRTKVWSKRQPPDQLQAGTVPAVAFSHYFEQNTALSSLRQRQPIMTPLTDACAVFGS